MKYLTPIEGKMLNWKLPGLSYQWLDENLGPSEFRGGHTKYCGTVESIIGGIINNGKKE